MVNQNTAVRQKYFFSTISLILSLLVTSQAHALIISVVDPGGNPVSGFRYLLEVDTTHVTTPGIPDTNSLSLGIHNSYAPVAMDGQFAAKGQVAGSTFEVGVSNRIRHMLTILPDNGFSMSGAHIKINQDLVTVTVSPLPLKAAQISVLVFEDNSPINSIADLPRETGLQGFSVVISDTAGQLNFDVFGNTLGTTYLRDAMGNPIINADGTPTIDQPGSGAFLSDTNGEVLIKNIAPGKYGIQVVPPAGSGWIQTNTIEGTHTIDAWVRSGEPAAFGEFGPPNKHVWFGFIKAFNNLPTVGATSTVTGRIVNAHNSAPPDFTFNPGQVIPQCWVGLNNLQSRTGVLAQPCNADSTFTLNSVPAGEYQLTIWDENLDIIFTIQGITAPASGGALALGDIPVFRWFSYFKSIVFFDRNKNGFRDCITASCTDVLVDDVPIPEQTVNLRFRDGSIYQSFPTDLSGEAPFDELFPFLRFLVAEVDYVRLKATGATIITDGGGAILPDGGWTYPSRGVLTPQPQCTSIDPITLTCNGPIINPNTGNNLSRTVTGPVLTMATGALLGLTNYIEWGKAPYDAGENGGISGIVYYSTTRAENDPRYAAAEPWEPGIPRVQVNLYQDTNFDGIIDDLNADGVVTLADVDNFPFGNFPGAEDNDQNANGIFNGGDAVQVATTDSWDDNLPTGCNAPAFTINGATAQDCFEGLRTFNQVRDGVFDGGYAFNSYFPGGIDSGSIEVLTLPIGFYIVEAVTPPGYEHIKEQDRNVDFGDPFTPSLLLLPPTCVGPLHVIPAELSLFPGTPAPFAGQSRPLCDRKVIALTEGQNAAGDFFMFTEVPKAARVVGLLLNDFANVFDPNHPSYGEKAAPPWLPISVQDFSGREIDRIYSDQFGTYNALLPSTYTVNVPSPSGVSPNMLRFCLNHPGPIPFVDDPTILITDPQFDPAFSQVCYTADFWPGKTTYLDTPVLPVAATAGRTDYPLDCEVPHVTPEIYSVSGPGGGPYIALTGQQITITSAIVNGLVVVPNPAYEAGTGTPLTILRDYGFGTLPGSVTVGGVALTNVIWNDVSIIATIPAGTLTGELIVTRGDNGNSNTVGITVTVGGPTPVQVPLGGSIQAAIDAATPGSLILVPPGTYNELLVVYKSIKLQGWGARSTIIDANKTSPALLANWQTKVAGLISSAAIDLIPGQTGLSNLEEGPGIVVLAKDGDFGPTSQARIDGFTISNATKGGAILVNAFARNLQISNNRIQDNSGNYGGGIRIGQPFLSSAGGGFVYADAFNDDIVIRRNQIIKNGTKAQVGGGISLYTGSDRYQVTGNFICGNFSAQDGGGLGHFGLSDQGLIANNTIVYNQVFQQTAGAGGAGGGLYISGGSPLGTALLSPGAGNITIDGNLIQGNQAGADDGGAIMLRYINGQDTAGAQNSWYKTSIINNIIVNNISGLAGAVTLQDTLKATIVNNTISNNDSTGTSASAFSAGPSISTPHAAGVVSRVHTPDLATAIAGSGLPAFSDPLLVNNIIWHNRAFFWDVTQNNNQGGLVPDISAGSAPVYDDLAVLGTVGALNPLSSILTSTAGYDASNIASDPLFIAEYNNGGPSHLLKAGPPTSIDSIPAFDEGGNFIDLSMGPLTLTDPVSGLLFADYHLQLLTSPAVNRGDSATAAASGVSMDFDRQYRPGGSAVDIGADEADGLLVPPVLDSDGDGVLDNVDNCILHSNVSQLDTDADGYGNRCDADLNNSSTVNITDYSIFGSHFGSVVGDANYNPDADFNGSGSINITDYSIFGSLWAKPPGPSALVP